MQSERTTEKRERGDGERGQKRIKVLLNDNDPESTAKGVSPLPILFDCDPGVDDAVMLLMALASQHAFNIIGVTTVSGNVPLNHVSNNALKLLELAGDLNKNIKVYPGCPKPILRDPLHIAHIHGDTGLGGSTLPEPSILSVENTHAVDFIISSVHTAVAKYNTKLTISVSGPMTNIGVALVKDPTIAANIELIICMGGSQSAGNITPHAEFNFYVDPHAVHIVFSSGIPIRMIGLDITTQVYATPERLAMIQSVGNKVSAQVCSMLKYGQDEWETPLGRCIHDACIIASLIDPTLITFTKKRVCINHNEEEFIGKSSVTEHDHCTDSNSNLGKSSGVGCTAWVADTVNADGIFELITTLLREYKD